MFHEIKQGCSGLLEFPLAEKVPLRFSGGLFFICIDERKIQILSLWRAADSVLFVFLFRERFGPKDFAVRSGATETTRHRADFPWVNS